MVDAASASPDRLDLLIKGGRVIDPGQNVDGVFDVGIKNGKIARFGSKIADDRAKDVIDASGMLVLAGIVDLHAHVYPYGSAIGIPADELAPLSCTTTAVSAGDAGANNFAAFRRHIVGQSRTRLFAFVHIANHGLAGYPVPEMRDLDHADVDAAARAVVENADIVLGIKVRQSQSVVGDNGLAPLRRAIAAAELAGGGARVMCHIGDVPGALSALLDVLRPGDIVTHAFSGAGNDIVRDGAVLGAAREAKQRGVLFDIGHGAGSFRLRGRGGRASAGLPAGHDLERYPCLQHEFPRQALHAVGHEQAPEPRDLALGCRRHVHGQSGADHRQDRQARHVAGGCACRCGDHGAHQRADALRRHAE